MIALTTAAALLPLLGVVVAPPTRPEEGCPSARQVTQALRARVPEALVPASSPQQPAAIPPRADLLRAVVDPAPDGQTVQFTLVDTRGEVRLKRSLRAATAGRARGSATECLALAETIATIVERFLQGIDYTAAAGELPPATPAPADAGRPGAPAAPADTAPPAPASPPPSTPGATGSPDPPSTTTAAAPLAPPAPVPAIPTAAATSDAGESTTPGPTDRRPTQPPPRGVLLAAGGGWRVPAGGDPDFEVRLTVAFDLTRDARRLSAFVAAGVSDMSEGRWDAGTGTLRRYPLAAGLQLAIPAPPGLIEPSLAVTVDLLSISSTPSAAGPTAPAPQAAHFLRAASGAEASLGLRVPITAAIYLKPAVHAGVAMLRYDVVTERTGDLVFRTARAYAILSLGAGVVFR